MYIHKNRMHLNLYFVCFFKLALLVKEMAAAFYYLDSAVVAAVNLAQTIRQLPLVLQLKQNDITNYENELENYHVWFLKNVTGLRDKISYI